MKIAISVPTMSSKGGGVPPVIRAHAKLLDAAGYNSRILTLDQEENSFFSRIPGLNTWGFTPGYSALLEKYAPDLIHVHGLWMYHDAAASFHAKRHRIPLIVSPHGMLDPWALRNSRWKKELAGLFFDRKMLRRAACIHALCESEYESIRACGLPNPVAVIPNGVFLPENISRRPEKLRRKLLFLGRLHPKKGIAELLRAWQKLKSRGRVGNWQLVIAGWGQNGYDVELKTLCGTLLPTPGDSHTTYCDAKDSRADVLFPGPCYGDEKTKLMQSCDAFILPSFSEGLPVAVLEAWSYGLPCLLTPQCNLPEGFESQAALKIDPEAESIAAALDRFLSLSDNELAGMGKRGYELVRRKFAWEIIVDQLLQVYRWSAGQSEKPPFIREN